MYALQAAQDLGVVELCSSNLCSALDDCGESGRSGTDCDVFSVGVDADDDVVAPVGDVGTALVALVVDDVRLTSKSSLSLI